MPPPFRVAGPQENSASTRMHVCTYVYMRTHTHQTPLAGAEPGAEPGAPTDGSPHHEAPVADALPHVPAAAPSPSPLPAAAGGWGGVVRRRVVAAGGCRGGALGVIAVRRGGKGKVRAGPRSCGMNVLPRRGPLVHASASHLFFIFCSLSSSFPSLRDCAQAARVAFTTSSHS